MRRLIFMLLFGCLLTVGIFAQVDSTLSADDSTRMDDNSDRRGLVHLITIDGAIHSVVTQTLQRAIERADAADVDALIIQMDTPGGLLESTHDITKTILNSPVPIVVYVAPDGARAGSAGVFITMAAHVAAMAPSTNIGAATPVGMGESPTVTDTSEVAQSDAEAMRRKVTNDAIANVRAMAEKHNRNADWAEKAVVEAASITATEALELNVIEYIAVDVDDLLEQMDGMIIEVQNREVMLNTNDAYVEEFEPTWRENFLNTLANPNLAYILMLVGFYGLIFELYNPGAIIPGVVGVICLILAFFALQTLPISWAGLLLIVLGLVMFVLEVYVTSFGILTLGGATSLVIGSVLLIDTDVPDMRVSWEVIIPTVLVTVAFFSFALTMALRAQKNKVTTGNEGMVGEQGVAVDDLAPRGKVKIGGEYWKAVADGDTIKEGDEIVVTSAGRLVVKVKRAD
jgi:membrane-bound serine protease (ClpP class)